MSYHLLYLIMILPALLPRIANAGGDGSAIDFTPPESDVSVKLLGYIFGVVDGVLIGGGSQIVGEMFGIFNSAVIVLGSIVIMYSVMISIINTAGEGTILGKQWSSIWVPLRSVVSIALLIPKASGYCTIQIMVMWVVVQGIGAADAVWGQALTYLQRGGVLIDKPVSQVSASTTNLANECDVYSDVPSDTPMRSSLRQLENECRRSVAQLGSNSDTAPDVSDKKAASAEILRALICMHSLERVLNNKRQELMAVSNTDVDIVPAFGNYLNTIGGDGRVKTEILIPPVVTGNTGSSAYTDFAGVCGSIHIQAITQTELRTIADKFSNLPGIKLSNGQPNPNHPIISATAKARGIAVQQMINELSSTALRIVNNVYTDEGDDNKTKYHHVLGYWTTENDVKNWVGNASRTQFPMMSGYELVNAVNAYVALMRPALRLIQGGTGDINFIEEARARGWILAGSYFFDIVKSTEDAKAAQFQVNSVQAKYNFDRKLLVSETAECAIGSGGTAKPCYLNYIRNGESQRTVLSMDNFNNSATPLGFCSYWKKPCGSSGSDVVEQYIISALQSQETTEASKESGMGHVMELAEVPKRSKSSFSCGTFLFDIRNCIAYLLDNIIFIPIANALIGMINWIVVPSFSAVIFQPIIASGTIFNASIKASYEPGSNPILEIAKFGNFLMSMAVNMVFGVLVWGLFTIIMPGPLFLIGIPIFLLLAPMVLVLVGTLWGIGLMMAFYVPLVPYVVFTMAALGWLISVIEAMVAAPIVALGLAHPEGDENLGQAEASVMLLANVFLRPSLMILGFVIAMILTYVVVILFNVGFVRVNEMIIKTSEGGFGQFMAPIMMMIFYGSFYMKLVEKCFELIYLLPDQVLTWIGGRPDDLGQRSAEGLGAAMKEQIQKVDSSGKKVGGGVIRGVKNVARVGAAAVTKGKSESSGAAGAVDSATEPGDGK